MPECSTFGDSKIGLSAVCWSLCPRVSFSLPLMVSVTPFLTLGLQRSGLPILLFPLHLFAVVFLQRMTCPY